MTVDQPDAKEEAPKDVASTLPAPQEEKAEEQEQQGEAPKFVCTLCQKQYSSKAGLRRHVSQNHNPKRTLKCEFPGCKSSFISQANLACHMKTHEENRSVVCEHCKQEFKSSVGLKLHHKRHGNPGDCIGKGKRKRRTREKEKENRSENGQQNSKKIKPTGSGTMGHHEVENLSRTLQPEQPVSTTGVDPKQEPPTTPASTEITAPIPTTLTNTEVITMTTPSVPTTPTTVAKAFQQLTTAVFTAITPTTLTLIAPVLPPTTPIPTSIPLLPPPTPIATVATPPPTPISTSALLSPPQTPQISIPTTSTKTATELPKPLHSINEKFAEPTDVSSPVADTPPTPLSSPPTEMAGRDEQAIKTPPSLWYVPKSRAFAYPASFYLSCSL
ncbi:hypothetical protein QOT17_011228 [Balamuthia mandrillaris]